MAKEIFSAKTCMQPNNDSSQADNFCPVGCPALKCNGWNKGERGDSNPRVAEPQSAALTPWLRSPRAFLNIAFRAVLLARLAKYSCRTGLGLDWEAGLSMSLHQAMLA